MTVLPQWPLILQVQKKKMICALLFLQNSCFIPCTGQTCSCELSMQSKEGYLLSVQPYCFLRKFGRHVLHDPEKLKVCLQKLGVDRSR